MGEKYDRCRYCSSIAQSSYFSMHLPSSLGADGKGKQGSHDDISLRL